MTCFACLRCGHRHRNPMIRGSRCVACSYQASELVEIQPKKPPEVSLATHRLATPPRPEDPRAEIQWMAARIECGLPFFEDDR